VNTPHANKKHTRYNISVQSIYWHVEIIDIIYWHVEIIDIMFTSECEMLLLLS